MDGERFDAWTRRERGSRVVGVVIDAGGRVRVTETVARDKGQVRRVAVGGAELKLVEEASRRLTATGTVGSVAQVEAILAAADEGLASLEATDAADDGNDEADQAPADLPSWARGARRDADR